MMQQRPDNAPAEVERVAAKCFGYYAGNGWKVGRNPMKDWKGACQTFLADLPKAAPGQPQAPMATAYRQDFQRPQPVSQVEKRMSLSAQLREKYQPQS